MMKSPHLITYFWSIGQEFTLDQNIIHDLEQFVSAMYNRPTMKSVDEARYKLFCSQSLGEQKLPPTSDALMLHCKRVNYQSAIHHRATERFIEAPSPTFHGWVERNGALTVHWLSKPPAPKELLEATKCNCKKTKCETNQCSCRSKGLSCTECCGCQNCANDEQTRAEMELMDDESGTDDDSDDEL